MDTTNHDSHRRYHTIISVRNISPKRTLYISMLFVGVNDQDIPGSKARPAHLFFDDLAKSLVAIKEDRYFIDKRRVER